MATSITPAGTPVSLQQLSTEVGGTSQWAQLPDCRWWVVMGSTQGMGAGGYEIWGRWGTLEWQIDTVGNGGHSTPLPSFPDGFVQIRNGASFATYFLSAAG